MSPFCPLGKTHICHPLAQFILCDFSVSMPICLPHFSLSISYLASDFPEKRYDFITLHLLLEWPSFGDVMTSYPWR